MVNIKQLRLAKMKNCTLMNHMIQHCEKTPSQKNLKKLIVNHEDLAFFTTCFMNKNRLNSLIRIRFNASFILTYPSVFFLYKKIFL